MIEQWNKGILVAYQTVNDIIDTVFKGVKQCRFYIVEREYFCNAALPPSYIIHSVCGPPEC